MRIMFRCLEWPDNVNGVERVRREELLFICIMTITGSLCAK